MCDTILAPPTNTSEGVMLFGKNSDRQRNEAQVVEYLSSGDHAAGSTVTCQYMEIPQIRHTHAALLCRPYWMWGAEMGANEHGVAVGNEAVHARSPASQGPALTGIDLVRLALERARSAMQAVDVVTTLLQQYGQGGNCGHMKASYYNNSFMIADATEAYVLETVGREWLLQQVHSVHSISNRYSIVDGAQGISAGLLSLIRDSGWSIDAVPRYAEALADPHRDHIGSAGARRARSMSLLTTADGQLGVIDMMRILRDHGPTGDMRWSPASAAKPTICMHAGAEQYAGQTVGALISELHSQGATHWVTCTAAPCISIFKPMLIDAPPPAHGRRPADCFDPTTLWWRHEQLHRAALLGDFERFIDEIAPERDALEAEFVSRIAAVLRGGSAVERARVVAECWDRAIAVEGQWCTRLGATPSLRDTPYAAAWAEMNRLAGFSAWRTAAKG